MARELRPGESLDPQNNSSLQEPIEHLRRRLAHGWSRHKAVEAWKRWGKNKGQDFQPKWNDPDWIDNNDSFVKWVMNQPEGALRKWEANLGNELPIKADLKTVSYDWRKSLDEALPLIFMLGFVCDSIDSTGQEHGHQKQVAMEELLAAPDFQSLSESAKWAAKWAIEHQKQNADGSWTIEAQAGEMMRAGR